MSTALQSAGRTGWFTPAEDELRARATAHLDAYVLPHTGDWERAGSLPLRRILRGLAGEGLLGMRFPRERGGGGGTAWDHVVLAEALGTVESDSVGMGVTVHHDMVAPMIAEAGSPEAVDRFLRPALAGDLVLAHAVSERSAGSDPSAVTTEAVRVPGGYRVTGVKRWVVAGLYADAFAVLARLPQARGTFGYVLLTVPADAEGVRVLPGAPTLGLRAAGVAGEVSLEDVHVPDAYRLGGHGLGLVLQLRQFEPERIISACRALSLTSTLLTRTRRRLAERGTFGTLLETRGQLTDRLAALRAETETVRQLAYHGIDLWATGGDFRPLSAAVKLRSSRLARAAARTCLHLHGAEGQLLDHPVNRGYRDSRLLSLSTGSDEMMMTALARLRGWPHG